MKYLQFLLRNLLRNRRRTILTITSIAVSLFLVTTMRTLLTELESPPETPGSALRLITTAPRLACQHPAHLVPCQDCPGARRGGGGRDRCGSEGVYNDPKNFFPQFAVDTDQFFAVNSDMELPEEQRQAFLADRTGALVGDNLAERFGWKVDDKIRSDRGPVRVRSRVYRARHLPCRVGRRQQPFLPLGVFQRRDQSERFRIERLSPGPFRSGCARPAEVAAVAQQVDDLFRNSTAPTKTETEKAFVLGFIAMMGNVRLLITAISSVVIFTIVLVAANTMAMSIRERVREIGILKALGFRKAHVLSLLIGESTSARLERRADRLSGSQAALFEASSCPPLPPVLCSDST